MKDNKQRKVAVTLDSGEEEEREEVEKKGRAC